jgi:hypothetical protein
MDEGSFVKPTKNAALARVYMGRENDHTRQTTGNYTKIPVTCFTNMKTSDASEAVKALFTLDLQSPVLILP